MYNVPCGDDKKWRVNAPTPVSPPINTVYCSSSHPLHSGLGLLTAFLICSNQKKYVLDSHCPLLISLLKKKKKNQFLPKSQAAYLFLCLEFVVSDSNLETRRKFAVQNLESPGSSGGVDSTAWSTPHFGTGKINALQLPWGMGGCSCQELTDASHY